MTVQVLSKQINFAQGRSKDSITQNPPLYAASFSNVIFVSECSEGVCHVKNGSSL